MSKKITGTIAELVAMGLTINGKVMKQGELSTLTRLGLAKQVGEAEKKGRGKAAAIWELESSSTLKLEAVTTKSAAPVEA